MAAFNKFNAFVADVANKVHNLGSDTLKVMLSNTLPTSANAVKADITEISAGNGYSAGDARLVVAVRRHLHAQAQQRDVHCVVGKHRAVPVLRALQCDAGGRQSD